MPRRAPFSGPETRRHFPLAFPLGAATLGVPMHTASSGVIRAASPSAFTSATLAAAVAATRHAERIRHACAAVDAASADATRAVRDAVAVHRRTAKARAAIAAAEAAEAAAERVAEATAVALGREAAEAAERVALSTLARATFADRLAALADGPLWTGSGYCAALADATRALGADKREVNVDALGAEDGRALAHVVVGTSAWTGEPCAFGVVARTASRDSFDAYRVYVPEVRAYGADADRERGAGILNLTSTNLTAADAPALAEAANVAAALCAVVSRYAAAHPRDTAMDGARAALAAAYATAYGEPLPERD